MKVKQSISKSYTHAEALRLRDKSLEVGQSIGFTISLDSETHNRVLVFAHGNNPNKVMLSRSGAVQLLLKLGFAHSQHLSDEEARVNSQNQTPSDTSQSTIAHSLKRKEPVKSPQS